jgi:hypothetical protein
MIKLKPKSSDKKCHCEWNEAISSFPMGLPRTLWVLAMTDKFTRLLLLSLDLGKNKLINNDSYMSFQLVWNLSEREGFRTSRNDRNDCVHILFFELFW